MRRVLLVMVAFVMVGVTLSSCSSDPKSSYPRLYTSKSQQAKIAKRVVEQEWAKNSFEAIVESVEPYVERHKSDPEWITSRMSMYWKDGERYTQCYLKKQNWDRGEGNAPVPTLRMPGMRTWNKYYNVPLEDRIPYNESGDMLGIDRLNPDAEPVLVPYKESGHMVRYNNVEILTLAENASFVYWVTGDESYARFAADIYYTWLTGIYYMNPILDPENSCGGPGGWEPGGICGYYDYEQIHDDLAKHTTPIFNFLGRYLRKHPNAHLKSIHKSVHDVSIEVFKRFIDLGMIRGGAKGNWNVNGWNSMMRAIVTLESNDKYDDGKGREYYLHYFLNESTQYRTSLDGILENYDKVSGLWNESPGYSLGIINTLLDFAVQLKNVDVDIIADYPILQRATLALFSWLDPNGKIVVFGDTRGGDPNFETFERLLAYYQIVGDGENAATVATALQSALEDGIYDRNSVGWEGICVYADDFTSSGKQKEAVMVHSAHHKHTILKDYNGEEKLMATLYGGLHGYHLSRNGLALQFYAFGYALAPDATGYESYWSADVAYHQTSLGSNTIVPGYTDGDIKVNYLYPPIENGDYMTTEHSNFYTYADVSAAEKRRAVATVRTGDDGGYYVDIFNSNQNENDYIFHNVGEALTFTDKSGKELKSKAQEKITSPHYTAYSYFKSPEAVEWSGDFIAKWDVTDEIKVDFHHLGGSSRTLYKVEAPYSTLLKDLTPEGVSSSPGTTPTMIIRQSGSAPFVGIYDAYKGSPKVVKVDGTVKGDVVKVKVTLADGRVDTITYSEAKGLTISRKK
ncbi:MAG: hypothetical protein SNG96_00205 [Rikenellaceae bacterium]